MNWIYQHQFFVLSSLLAVASATLGFLFSKINKKIKVLWGDNETATENIQQDFLRRITKTEIKLEELEPRLRVVESIADLSIQKTGFLRFNPFPGTGGDNSFVIAFLDRENNGMLLSSLYTRDGVRIYAKQIERGKPKHALSEEEAKVLEETLRK